MLPNALDLRLSLFYVVGMKKARFMLAAFGTAAMAFCPCKGWGSVDYKNAGMFAHPVHAGRQKNDSSSKDEKEPKKVLERQYRHNPNWPNPEPKGAEEYQAAAGKNYLAQFTYN